MVIFGILFIYCSELAILILSEVVVLATMSDLDFRYISKYNEFRMKKIETIWHHLLFQALTERKYKHTQQEIAQNFHYSLSTVNHALRVPVEMGAIRKESKFFVLKDARKLLYYWASVRNLRRDTLYSTYVSYSVPEIEGLAIPKSVFAAYTVAKRLLKEAPTDYDKVYFYIAPTELEAFIRRFPKGTKQPPNLFALKMPPTMKRYGLESTIVQTYVDIWNLSDWYARDFTNALEGKIHVLLS